MGTSADRDIRMSILAWAIATTSGLLIGATALSFVPSNEWWIRALDFPRLQIAGALVVLGACVALVHRGRWRTVLIAGLALALVAQQDQRRPAILAGDLNDVAWSRTSWQLQQTAALRDPRVGRGLFATFNADLPAGFRWPLDHVFLTDGFALCGLKRLGHVGSDHFPVLVDVVLEREGR